MPKIIYRRISDDKVEIVSGDHSLCVTRSTIQAALSNAEENPMCFGSDEACAAYKAMYEGALDALDRESNLCCS